MKNTTATPWIQHPRFLKILYPTLVAVAMVLLWQGAVSYFRIPAFLVPSPLVMLESLWTHLTPPAAGAAVHPQDHPDLVSAVDCHRRRGGVYPGAEPLCGNRPVSLHRVFAGDADRRHRPADHHLGEGCHASLVVCATLMAVFPIISNTTQGLRSVSPAC